MDDRLFNEEAKNVWKPAATKQAPNLLAPELELANKMMKIIQVGEYFYWIFNLTTYSLDVVSENMKNILGYSTSEFNFDLLMNCIHPDDRPYFLNFENRTREFLDTLPIDKLMKYKTRYDFRIKRKDGKYIRLLHQAIIIQHDEQGKIMRTLGVETDISHLKQSGKTTLSFIGLDGEPSYFDVDAKAIFAVSREFLSKREKQVLLLIIEGKLSKEIAYILHVSKQTVDSHRNNMIAKANVKNTSELIAVAIRQGWI